MTILSTFTTTIEADRTVRVPKNIPVGAKVTITVAAEDAMETEENRYLRFESVMEAIRMAMAEGFVPPKISDSELNALIKRARKSKK